MSHSTPPVNEPNSTSTLLVEPGVLVAKKHHLLVRWSHWLIERAVIRSNNGVLPNTLPKSDVNVATNPPVSDKSPVAAALSQDTFEDSTRALILQSLQSAGWIIGGPCGAAARLGLRRTTLIAKMKKLGISRPRRRSD